MKAYYDVIRPRAPKRTTSFLNYFNLLAGMRFVANKVFGSLLGRIILKAQTLNFSDEIAKKTSFIASNKGDLNIQQKKIFSEDGSELDTLELSSKTQDKLSEKKHTDPIYVLNFVGYDMCYEQILDDMKRDVDDFAAKGFNAHVIGFNYRNVAESRGKVRSKDDLVKDGIAQVQALLDQGVKPENITLKAYSLGGGIGTLVAEHFYKNDTPVYLFNNRSFSRLSTTVSEWIRTGKRSGYRDKNVWTQMAGIITKPFIWFGLNMAKWEIDAASAYKRLPEQFKTLIVARSNPNQRARLYTRTDTQDGKLPQHFRIKDDATVSFRSSLFQAVKSSYTPKQRKKMKMSLANNHALNQDLYARNGHTAPMTDIENKTGVSAHRFFHQFVTEVYPTPELLERRAVLRPVRTHH